MVHVRFLIMTQAFLVYEGVSEFATLSLIGIYTDKSDLEDDLQAYIEELTEDMDFSFGITREKFIDKQMDELYRNSRTTANSFFIMYETVTANKLHKIV